MRSNNNQRWTELMKKSQSGYKKEYELLLNELSVFLNNYFKNKISKKSDIDDIVQETLIAIDKAKHTFDANRSFMSWFLAIAHYKIADYYRADIRRSDLEVVDTDALVEITCNQNNPEIEYIYEAIEKLPAREREIVKLVKIDGFSMKEIAQRTKLSLSNVKILSHRSIKRIKEMIGEYK